LDEGSFDSHEIFVLAVGWVPLDDSARSGQSRTSRRPNKIFCEKFRQSIRELVIERWDVRVVTHARNSGLGSSNVAPI
jgi:hypothetical protein